MKDSNSRSRLFDANKVLSLKDVRWFELDWHILGIAVLLLGLGLVFVHAMSDADLLADRKDVVFQKHMQKVVLAVPAFFVALAIRPRFLRRNAYVFYGVCLAMLIGIFLVGAERNGARRWITIPGIEFDLQPSELAKIGVIVALAQVLYRNRLAKLRDWGKPLLVALVPMGLVAMQPDLGTAMTLAPITLGMLYLAGARAKVIGAFLVGTAVIAFSVVWLEIGVHDYQLQRIDTWRHSFAADDLIAARGGPAFHSYHARVAIGNGGVFGRGIGDGVANETGYLPERDCDSVFAVVAEEAGWLGTMIVLFVYILFIVLLMGSASSLRDRFARLAVGGVALYFAAHVFINVGVNLGLVPLTGLTLPMFSTGGSSMLTTFAALGLALGLCAHHEPVLDADGFKD
ncbi:MAG: FtsW/RodA/SpoVE family cell cycle protein [Planctomycetota bacterium]|nr:FtsW/RodA/SpoVE family cell cycle protein [Planctomycetota bacterium]